MQSIVQLLTCREDIDIEGVSFYSLQISQFSRLELCFVVDDVSKWCSLEYTIGHTRSSFYTGGACRFVEGLQATLKGGHVARQCMYIIYRHI